jgi:hypothetical protein
MFIFWRFSGLTFIDLRLADLFLGFTLSRFGLAVSPFLGVPSCSKTKDRVFYTVYFTGTAEYRTTGRFGWGWLSAVATATPPPTLTSWTPHLRHRGCQLYSVAPYHWLRMVLGERRKISALFLVLGVVGRLVKWYILQLENLCVCVMI